jgi:prolyl-tRNA synthetase
VPIVVIAGESTETPSGALQKELDVKEMRLASEDLIKEFFSCGKDDGQLSLSLPGSSSNC